MDESRTPTQILPAMFRKAVWLVRLWWATRRNRSHRGFYHPCGSPNYRPCYCRYWDFATEVYLRGVDV